MKSSWLRETIVDFKPYDVAAIVGQDIINANENYLDVLSIPEIKEEVMESLNRFQPQLYPKPMADELRKSMAAYIGCEPQNILAGNGGDEVIGYLMGTFLNPGDSVLLHTPTFDIYELNAKMLGAAVVKVPDLKGYRRDKKGLLKAVKKYQPKVTVICNPNNPTGELISLDFIREMLQISDNVVLVDEAYMEFAERESAVSLIHEYQNLVILRTMSKAFGLAGMRCGYLIADEALINAISKVKAPYNLNSFTQIMASIVLKYREKVLITRDKIVKERNRLYKILKQIPGVSVWRSDANFLLVQVEERQEEIFEAWKKDGILVKIYRDNEELPGAFRISITTKEVDDRLVEILQKEMT